MRTQMKDLVEFLKPHMMIWGERETPPSTYRPQDGVGVCCKIRGGRDDETDVIQFASVQFKVYGIDEVTASEGAEQLHQLLNHPVEPRSPGIKWARREVLGQTLQEPETEWIFVLVFYKIMFQVR